VGAQSNGFRKPPHCLLPSARFGECRAELDHGIGEAPVQGDSMSKRCDPLIQAAKSNKADASPGVQTEIPVPALERARLVQNRQRLGVPILFLEKHREIDRGASVRW